MPKSEKNIEGWIEVHKARVHNLKGVDIKLPRDKFIVITGLSGSGKSSLAFDTLYSEGQRRYVESLSSYARQFLGRLDKPDVDRISGLPPAIAIEQKVNTRNPRSTVGTSTEIYDYLKLLYARIGESVSPVSGQKVEKHDVSDVVDYIMGLPLGTQVMILSPLSIHKGRSLKEALEILAQQGFSRIEEDGKVKKINEILDTGNVLCSNCNYSVLVDRIIVDPDEDFPARLADSAQTAFYEGKGECTVKVFTEDDHNETSFTDRFEADGIIFEIPSVHMFSFNNPVGACPRCEGFGNTIGIDEDLVVPNKNLSVYEDAIVSWKGEKMKLWKEDLISSASIFDFPIHKPYYQLSKENKQLIWAGNAHFRGLDDFFKHLEEKSYKIQYRVMLARYRGKTVCPDCQGLRLKKEATWVKVAGKSITELINMPISTLKGFFDEIVLGEHDMNIAKRLLTEISSRISYLVDVGLGYLTLNRSSNTLSGGESQRINLASSLGSSLVGSLYILDEPSIGLHPKDTSRLIGVLKDLQNLGNTVLVVEHDELIIRSADYIIDMGPRAGRLGGKVVYQGDLQSMPKNIDSLTARYLNKTELIPIPEIRRPWNHYIHLKGASENNLKSLDVKFPLEVFTVVTGVSGSGKSSLVHKTLYAALGKNLGVFSGRTGQYGTLNGDIHLVQQIEMVDQNPIGRSSRSNPVTYIKAYDEIRKLFSEQPFSKVNGYKPAHFSFNVDGGRCEECQGEGEIKVEMQFMADVYLICDHCHGKRFKDEILDVRYHGKNIYDILDMTVEEAIEFFDLQQDNSSRKINQKLKPLADVGLGYVKLGQSSSTLSGGESQRVKLASFLTKGNDPGHTMFIFDEPTTGLHFHDIKILLTAFNALLDRGHTIIVIEHNTEVIKSADWVIDLGPEGGQNGGNIIFEGTPEELTNNKQSFTGEFLKHHFDGK